MSPEAHNGNGTPDRGRMVEYLYSRFPYHGARRLATELETSGFSGTNADALHRALDPFLEGKEITVNKDQRGEVLNSPSRLPLWDRAKVRQIVQSWQHKPRDRYFWERP